MKCFEIQNEIPEYLEDLLAENVRSKIHAHLTECSACRNHAARLGSLAGDLKELARAPIPFNLEHAVLEELSSEPPLFSVSFSGRKAAAVFFTVLGLAGILKAGHEIKQHLKTAKTVESKTVEDAQADAILEKLKQTEANLARMNGEAGAKAPSRRMVSSLEPFHWHLKFSSVSERQVFIEKIKRMNTQTEFGAEYLMAFSMDQSIFKNLLAAIDASPAVVADGPKADLKNLPQSEAPLRVTLLMEADGIKNTPFWWQLQFLRQNSYLLARRLHENGFEFIYESPHFVVLRVSAAQYKKLRLEIQEMLGAQIIRGKGDETSLGNSQEKFPVILFLQEG